MNYDDAASLIRQRRTSMLVDKDRDVPFGVIYELCELAQWAPNHKRTWPWRFAFVDGDGRAKLGDTIADAMVANGEPEDRVLKTRGKYLRTPATLVVGAAAGDSPMRTGENRDAAAAGVQTLMLAATAKGLATYWGSCPKGAEEAVGALCGFEPGTHITALIYVGWARDDHEIDPPARPLPVIARVQ